MINSSLRGAERRSAPGGFDFSGFLDCFATARNDEFRINQRLLKRSYKKEWQKFIMNIRMSNTDDIEKILTVLESGRVDIIFSIGIQNG